MIGWELHKPPTEKSPDWLEEISELRGRVLYENGRRPAFRLPIGRYADPDPLDVHAYHIIARSGGKAVGCVRTVPIAEGVVGITECLLGQKQFAEMLTSLDMDRRDVVESSRWTVDPFFRASRIGVLLAAGGVAVARALGFKLLLCSVGTRNKQDIILSRLGVRRVAGLSLIPVPEFNDDLCVMQIQPHHPQPHFAELMAEMDAELMLASSRNSDEKNLPKQMFHRA
jgi:N-acyl-L-homoserine lactone synthetase